MSKLLIEDKLIVLDLKHTLPTLLY